MVYYLTTLSTACSTTSNENELEWGSYTAYQIRIVIRINERHKRLTNKQDFKNRFCHHRTEVGGRQLAGHWTSTEDESSACEELSSTFNETGSVCEKTFTKIRSVCHGISFKINCNTAPAIYTRVYTTVSFLQAVRLKWCGHFSCPMRATSIIHLILPDLFALIIFSSRAAINYKPHIWMVLVNNRAVADSRQGVILPTWGLGEELSKNFTW